jgi:hypothetical protein
MARDALALIAFIDSRQNAPWEWGTNDCISYVLGAVEAQTGRKILDVKWKSSATALRKLKKYGTLEAALDAHFERIAPAFAKRGDIAGVPDEQFGIHTAIVEGATLVGPGEKGNWRGPRSEMTIAWSVESLRE